MRVFFLLSSILIVFTNCSKPMPQKIIIIERNINKEQVSFQIENSDTIKQIVNILNKRSVPIFPAKFFNKYLIAYVFPDDTINFVAGYGYIRVNRTTYSIDGFEKLEEVINSLDTASIIK